MRLAYSEEVLLRVADEAFFALIFPSL